MRSIRKDIADKSFKNVYLVYGAEQYLKEYYTKAILDAACPADSRDFNYLKFSHCKPDESQTESFVYSYPLINDKKVLEIKDSGLMKKATESDKKFWTDLLKNLPDYIIIIFNESEVDKRNAIYKAVNTGFYAIEIPYQKKSDLMNWCAKILKSNSKVMTEQEIEYFINNCDEGMINIKKELDKLMMYKRENPHITKDDVDLLVAKSVQNQVFKMAEDMIEGDMKSAVKKLDDLRFLGSEPIAVISAIFAKFSAYRKLKLLSDRSIYEIASVTGQREYFIKNDLNKLSNVSIEYLDKVLYKCQKADYRIKSGQAIAWSELEILITCN